MTAACVDITALTDRRGALEKTACSPGSACAAALARADAILAGNPQRIELREFVALLEEIGRSCRPSALAWSVGQSIELPFGPDLGRVILGCRTLGAALHWLCQYFPLLQDASVLRLDVDEDWSSLSYKILEPAIWPRHEDAMYSLGIYAKIIRAAAPDAWSHCRVVVEAEADQVRADLPAIVQTSVAYGGSANAIRFPTSIVNAPLRLGPPGEPETVKRLSSALSRKMRTMSMIERTRLMIFAEMNDGCVSQEHIARELGISSRTLRRRLAEEDQSFQALLDECRMAFAALEFRTRRKLSLSDMAFRLGYSEHSTFSRAFARWAGMAPQDYRRSVAPHAA